MADSGTPPNGKTDVEAKDKEEAQGQVEEKESDEESAEEGAFASVDGMVQSFKDTLSGLADRFSFKLPEKEKNIQVLEDLTLEGVAKYIRDGKCKNIVFMTGAGVSTSAGIPDFRSPNTGLYANLQKYNLPHPQAIFDIGFFRENPEPFFALAKELWPGCFKPSPGHYFIRLLHEKGLLLRCFTQNIDTLERVAGLPADKIIEAHGTFATSHCVECSAEYTQEWMKEKIFADLVPKCEECDELVKPDIVFFGESLPSMFFNRARSDLPVCDLLIVMGTSLVVHPFASLVSAVSDTCPRLYINLENTGGKCDPLMMLLGMGSGFMFESEDNYRDVFKQATCDDGCQQLADLLGWGDELKDMIKTGHAKIDKEAKTASGKDKAQSVDSPAEAKASPVKTKAEQSDVKSAPSGKDNDTDAKPPSSL